MLSRGNQINSPQIVLDVNNITIRTKAGLCFRGTNWRVLADEQWAVIGPTGAGKSTFVKALCGNLPVVEGRIINYFDGSSKSRAYPHRGEIILVSAETQRDVLRQYAGFHQARWQSMEGDGVPTVKEFLHGDSVDERIKDETSYPNGEAGDLAIHLAQAAALLGIDRLMDRKIIHLSNGEGRKVLLVHALARSPRLLILDDPFGALDAETRQILIQSLTTILEGRQQRLLLVTSRAEEIPEGITHVLGIAGHQVAAQGTKAAVSASAFARKLFNGSPEPARNDFIFPAIAWSASPPGTPLVEFRQTSVKYQGVNVLQDITWTMRQGEHWGIRGPNGAGKSTLLSLILGDNPQVYANDVTILGMRRGTGESIWDIKKHIGWVAPEIHFYYQNRVDCLTVVCSGFFDSVGLYRHVTAEQSRIAAEWMRVLGVARLAEQPFYEVSIGEQRLILLARALVKQPRLVILDEPCQGLDGTHRARILEVLEALCEQTPISILYVTHHLDELPRAVKRVLWLKQGRMMAVE